ncbi:hypothetical protein M0804_012295 [Polistes exclamans]|nr:hypothetical protein M0804_012295 [Polistes exclamans]
MRKLLAFLLFLLAFGHSGLLKSSVPKLSARSYSLSSSFCGINPGKLTGLVGIGSIVSSVVVSGAPIDLITDAGVRAERSANLSHITGASRKIQMYIKNRHLQILPDGTVNGSNDDTSDYSRSDIDSCSTFPIKSHKINKYDYDDGEDDGEDDKDEKN